MVFFCKQNNSQLFIHSQSNTIRSRAYYLRRLYQSSLDNNNNNSNNNNGNSNNNDNDD